MNSSRVALEARDTAACPTDMSNPWKPALRMLCWGTAIVSVLGVGRGHAELSEGLEPRVGEIPEVGGSEREFGRGEG
jgi:hypothetical protein